jgi:hypothetical protein
MSEMEAYHNCVKCGKDTLHMFSGSGTKGLCLKCGHELDPEVRADVSRCVSYNG